MEPSVQIICLEYLDCLRQILLCTENEALMSVIDMTAHLMLYGFRRKELPSGFGGKPLQKHLRYK